MAIAMGIAIDAWAPRSEEELIARWVNDHAYFLQTCTTITTDEGRFQPFLWNGLQNRAWRELAVEVRPNVWVYVVLDGTEVKVRQYGSTTQKVGLQYAQCALGNWSTVTVAYRDDTAQAIKRKVDLIHESALDSVRDILGRDPYEILPNFHSGIDNKHEMYDPRRGCGMLFLSERTKGAGRGGTASSLYITDLGEWTTYDEAIAGLAGMLAKTGEEIVWRDGTGKGPGNALHQEFTRCEEAQQADPTGPTRAIFYGVQDADYSEEYLARQLKLMGPSKFRREYPLVPKDAFTGDPNARFNPDHINACQEREPRYLVDFMSDAEIRARCVPVRCIDSAEGTEAGDFACIVDRDALTGLMIQEPYCKRASPTLTVAEVKARHARFPGLCNPLRKNHGSAVIALLEQEPGMRPWLYTQDVGNCDGKVGLDENGATIPVMQAAYEAALADTNINLPWAHGALQVTIFGLQKNGRVEAPPGFHDDYVVADAGCVLSFPQALRKHTAMRVPVTPFVQHSIRESEEWQ